MRQAAAQLRCLLWILPAAAILQCALAVAASAGIISNNSIPQYNWDESVNSSRGNLHVGTTQWRMKTAYRCSGFNHKGVLQHPEQSQRGLQVAEALPPDSWECAAQEIYRIESGWPLRSLSGEVGANTVGTWPGATHKVIKNWNFTVLDWPPDRSGPLGFPSHIRIYETLVNTLFWSLPIIAMAAAVNVSKRVFAALRGERRFNHAKCPGCGYEVSPALRARTDRCPECGEMYFDQSPLIKFARPPLSRPIAPYLVSALCAGAVFLAALIQFSVLASVYFAIGTAMTYALGFIRPRWFFIPLMAPLAGSIIFFAGICNFFNIPDAAVTAMSLLVGIGLPAAFFAGQLHKNLITPSTLVRPDAEAPNE